MAISSAWNRVRDFNMSFNTAVAAVHERTYHPPIPGESTGGIAGLIKPYLKTNAEDFSVDAYKPCSQWMEANAIW